MKLLYRRCAGLDVHKSSVTVCVRRCVPGSSQVEMEEAVFATFTQDLRRLGGSGGRAIHTGTDGESGDQQTADKDGGTRSGSRRPAR